MNRFLILTVILFSVTSCVDDSENTVDPPINMDRASCESSAPIGEDYDLGLPFYAPPTYIPADNPMKSASVALGRHLFWDVRLSGDNTISCATCHQPAAGFSDPLPLSVGIDGLTGHRNSMAIVNLVFQPIITWDGGVSTLEQQSIEPVLNPVEMHEDWSVALTELDADTLYDRLFEEAYGTDCKDVERASKSIAQFMRSMVSFNSKYDRAQYGPESFTPLEQLGLEIWDQEGGSPPEVMGGQEGADCFHCHSLATENFTDNQFHNNGLDSVFTDLGQGGVTGIAGQNGRFKTPTLRNIEYTAPYMHDGRFATLEEVIDHYDSGGHPSATVDPFMKFSSGGLQLTDEKKAGLVAFLKALSDPDFIADERFSNPF